MKKTVLITGAGGLIGTILRNGLADTYTVRLMSLHPIAGVDSITADINDMKAMQEACKGVNSIIHLAAIPSPSQPWEDALHSNISGTYTVYEAAAQAGVKQIIFASSNHAVGTHDMENAPDIYLTGKPVLDHLVPVRPDSYYGVSKCFGEDLGRYYADHRGLHVLNLRIGWTNKHDSPYGIGHKVLAQRLAAIWLSHRDLLQLVEKSLEADNIKFDTFYGISNNRPHFYDLEHAREVLGYEPQDSADVPGGEQQDQESSKAHR